MWIGISLKILRSAPAHRPSFTRLVMYHGWQPSLLNVLPMTMCGCLLHYNDFSVYVNSHSLINFLQVRRCFYTFLPIRHSHPFFLFGFQYSMYIKLNSSESAGKHLWDGSTVNQNLLFTPAPPFIYLFICFPFFCCFSVCNSYLFLLVSTLSIEYLLI